jgi:hypothetical protein
VHLEDLDLQPIALGEAGVHAEEISREQRRLVSAGPGADFDDRIAILEWIPGNEQLTQLQLDRLDLTRKALDVAAASAARSGSVSAASSRACASSSLSRASRSAVR